jgi:6-phosphofructokinase 1
MGRESGFIAVNATLSLTDVNFTLIPEVPFDLEGPNGFLTHLETRMRKRDHAVICVAEGAGQDILLRNQNVEYDASGNIKLADIGLFLKDYIVTYFKKKNIKVNLKYIDPSYMIRSAPANANDSIFCALLGQYAVHAAMAGKTDMIVALWNNAFVHLPIKIVTAERKHVSPASSLWYNLLQATGQPISMKN